MLLGLIVFVAAEKIFSGLVNKVPEEEDNDTKEEQVNNNTNHISKSNGFAKPVNGIKPVKKEPVKQKQVSLLPFIISSPFQFIESILNPSPQGHPEIDSSIPIRNKFAGSWLLKPPSKFNRQFHTWSSGRRFLPNIPPFGSPDNIRDLNPRNPARGR